MRNGGRHRCRPPLSGHHSNAALRRISPGRPFGRSLREAMSPRAPELSGDGSVGPLSGAGLTWKALHHLVRALAEATALLKRWTAFPVRSGPFQLVGIAAFRDRVSVDVFVDPARFHPVGLATILPIPAVRRLCRPMLGSCHEPGRPPTENDRFFLKTGRQLWISPALATSGLCAAFL